MSAVRGNFLLGDEPASLHAVVRGLVQGVGYRSFVLRRAGALGLRGYVRNLRDGLSVEVVAEGRRAALEPFLEALRRGPAGAEVEQLEADWGESTGAFASFEVRPWGG